MITKTKNEIIVTETITKKYDIKKLQDERNIIMSQLDEKEPSQEELVEWGKMYHPYYSPKDYLQDRLKEINELLK